MKKTILAALLIATCRSAIASDWFKIAEFEQTSIYIDMKSVRRIGDSVRVWEMSNYRTAQSANNKLYKSVLFKVEYNCALERKRLLAGFEYSEQNAAGELVAGGNLTSSIGEWKEVIPNTVSDAQMQVACYK